MTDALSASTFSQVLPRTGGMPKGGAKAMKNMAKRRLMSEARETERWEAYCLSKMEDEVYKEDLRHRFRAENNLGFLADEMVPYVSYYLDEDGNPINVQKRLRFLEDDLIVEELEEL